MITRVSYHFNQHIYTNCTQLYINNQLVWMVKGHLAHSLIAYSIGAYSLQNLKHNEVKWRHALMIRVIYTWLSWLALGHKHNRIMAALGHSHNHSGMQDYSCSGIKCTTARRHKYHTDKDMYGCLQPMCKWNINPNILYVYPNHSLYWDPHSTPHSITASPGRVFEAWSKRYPPDPYPPCIL